MAPLYENRLDRPARCLGGGFASRTAKSRGRVFPRKHTVPISGRGELLNSRKSPARLPGVSRNLTRRVLFRAQRRENQNGKFAGKAFGNCQGNNQQRKSQPNR